MEFGFISLRGLNYPVFQCLSGLHESLGTSFCCCRSTFNVTTQKQGKVVLWLDECWVVERIERHDSQRGVCVSQSSVSDWGYCSTRDWQLGQGPLAPSWFLFLAGGVLWDLEFMLQYISRTAYGCNEDEKQTEHWASVFLSFYAALSFYKLPLSFSSAPCIWFTLDICLEKQGVTLSTVLLAVVPKWRN